MYACVAFHHPLVASTRTALLFCFYVSEFWVPFSENAVIDTTSKKCTVPTRPLNSKGTPLKREVILAKVC